MKALLMSLSLFLAASSAAQESPTSVVAPTASTNLATDWEDLFARAESAAQQWETKAGALEKQAAAELAEMDAETRAKVKKGLTEPLPPAPKSKSAAGDTKARFYAADVRGKAWRARAIVLEVRIRSWQPRLAEARVRRAAAASNKALGSSSDSGSNGSSSVGPTNVRGYQRASGTYVAPYNRSAPGGGGRR